MYSVLGWFYLSVPPGWLGLDTADLDVSIWAERRFYDAATEPPPGAVSG